MALAVPDGATGTAGVVLLTNVGGAGITDGLDVMTGGETTGTVDATSAGEVGTTGTTGTEVATSAGEVGTAVTGFVTVHGQLVIVRVVAWKEGVLAFSRFEVNARIFALGDHSWRALFLTHLSHNVG